MTEFIPSNDELPINDEPPGNPTYFAFAKPSLAETVQEPVKTRPSEMPRVLAGRYRIVRLLGAGGMGAVYLARDLLGEQFGDPDPYVALKILNEEFAGFEDACALLYSEFALTRSLRHDNVLRLYSFEVDTDCQYAFITMELMRGLTLDRLLCERPLGLPWGELRTIILPMLDALAYTHACGVLHGDIKPSNIMLSEDGVRLFDFGLGQAQHGALASLPHLSRERFNAWTPGYAAPEVLDGQPLTACADVYAVACVIYELAGGKPPFRRLPSTLARDERLDLEMHIPRKLPRHCWPALRNALSFDPYERTIDVAQLREVLSSTPSLLQRVGL